MADLIMHGDENEPRESLSKEEWQQIVITFIPNLIITKIRSFL